MTTPLSNGTALQLKATEDVVAAQEERRMLRKRQNEQMVIYLFVCSAIVVAWILGSWQFSFVWTFVIALATLAIWRSKMMTLTERNIQYSETILHRRRSLRQSESVEWLNLIINRWLTFTGDGISSFLKKHLNPRLNHGKPAFIDNIELDSLYLGGDSPIAKCVRMYECTDGLGGGKVPLSWTSANCLPRILSGAHEHQLVLEMNVEMHSDDCAMVFRARLGGKWAGMTVNIAVEKLYVKGRMQVIIQLNRDSPFPHVASASLSFLDKPEINFGIRALKIVDIMEMPLLKSWINNIVRQGIFDALVDPGKFLIDLKNDNLPAAVPSEIPANTRAEGVLTVVVRGDYITSSSGQSKKDRKGSKTNAWGWDTENESRECLMNVGSQTAAVVLSKGHSSFTAVGSFVINSLKQDKLIIKSKSKFILASQTLAKFEIALHGLTFDKQRGSCDLSLEKQLDKVFGGPTLRLSISSTFSNLPDLDKIMEFGRIQIPSAVDTVSGVVFICIHSATNLLAINENSLSNPYCLAYCNGKKVVCSHHVKKTKSPKWEVSAEFIVEDVSRSCLLFAIYNWNGRNSVDDEFLGAVQVPLSPDEPILVRKSISLVNSTLGLRHGVFEADNLGKIAVSAVFRPVAAIAEMGLPSGSFETVELVKSQKSVIDHHPGKLSVRENSMSSLGMVELNIIRAKDLTAMDSNGFSDPFCEVLINGRKVFTTKVQKKTLFPVWNECVTTDVPAKNEKLEIMMYDHDVITKNDFLGSVTFTQEDLKKIASNVEHDGWFVLEHPDTKSMKPKTGSIQLRIKVFLDETLMTKNIATAIGQTKEVATALFKVPKTSSCQDFGEVKNASSEPSSVKDPPVAIQKDGEQNGNVSVVTLASVYGAAPSDSHANDDNPALAEGNTVGGNTAGGSFKLPRKSPGSTPVRRIGSESRINGEEKDRELPSDVHIRITKSNSAYGIGSPGNSEYRGVRGVLRSIKGVSVSATSVYCKIRLLSNAGPGDKLKKASSGVVIAKSQSMVPAARLELNLNFDVDNGFGVSRSSMLNFDIKSGHFSHIATKMYTLQELLGDEGKSSTKWLPLDAGVEIKVQLSCEGIQSSHVSSRRPHSVIGSIRGLKKIKEN